MSQPGTNFAGPGARGHARPREQLEIVRMPERMTAARVRIAVAQLLHRRGIDVGDLYRALGIDPSEAESDALAHLAGVLDGLAAAGGEDDDERP